MQLPILKQTIAKSVSIEGIGLHTGQPARVTLNPFENGLDLLRTDMRPQRFALNPEEVQASPLCTLLKNSNGATLSTVEHLFAALHGLGLTDLEIEVQGPEVPILDGSALPWVELIEQARVMGMNGNVDTLSVTTPCHIEDGDRSLHAMAGQGLSIDCRIDFPHPQIGSQQWQGVMTPEIFKKEIAPARSFITESELEQARAAGFAKGASLQGGMLFLGNGTVANPEGLRFPNEPVRHKVLDAIGDLFMAGRPVQGEFTLVRPGHTVNNLLLRKIAL